MYCHQPWMDCSLGALYFVITVLTFVCSCRCLVLVVPGTFSNYVCYVKLGCELAKADCSVFESTALRRATNAVRKRRASRQREPKLIQQHLLARLLGAERRDGGDDIFAMALLCAYVFLLRVPSECLPIIFAGGDSSQASLTLVNDCLRLRLKTRKNRPQGSTLTRYCWCNQHMATCPVHVLGQWIQTRQIGEALFCSYTVASLLKRLRAALCDLGVEGALLHHCSQSVFCLLQNGKCIVHTIYAAALQGTCRLEVFCAYIRLPGIALVRHAR